MARFGLSADEIADAIATANTAAQNASAARATDDRAALLQSMRGLVRSSGGERAATQVPLRPIAHSRRTARGVRCEV